MRKIYEILGILSIIVLFSISAEGADRKSLSEQIRTPQKMIKKLSVDEVLIWGHWKKIASKASSPNLAQINATQVLCDKQEQVCKEATAELYTSEDRLFVPPFMGVVSSPSIMASYLEYRILDWSDNTIKAKYEGPIADIELKISVKDNFAERSFRETKARGSETSDPNIFYIWTLE